MFNHRFSHYLLCGLSASLIMPGLTAAAAETDASAQDTELLSASEIMTETQAPTETERYTETEIYTETETESETYTETETLTETQVTESESQDISDTDMTESETRETEPAPTETEKKSTEKKESETETKDTEGTDEDNGKEDTVIEQGTVDFVRSTTKVPVEGIPGALTQEMISAVLYCQDETGFPASLALAQLIAESVSSADTGSLTGQAYRTHDLFELSDTYNTDSESVFAFFDYLDSHDRDLLEVEDDLDLQVSRFAQRWTSESGYGQRLIDIIDRYQLYRLDQITLEDFEDLLPTYVNPCPGTVISSTFGYRELFHSMHEGIDLATGGRHIATYAARGGVVIAAGDYGLAGNMISIRHSDGTVTDYMHHYKMFVSVGDYVFKGQQIGLAGSTGRSTGIHLHFQVNIGGAAVNPAPYLKDDSSGKVIPLGEGRQKKKRIYTLSREVIGRVMNGGIPSKHEQTVPKVTKSNLPHESGKDVQSARQETEQTDPEQKIALSEAILGSLMNSGIPPKHEMAISHLSRYGFTGTAGTDLTSLHDE